MSTDNSQSSSVDIQVGKKIRERRLICGLSQADLAKKKLALHLNWYKNMRLV